VPGHHFVWIAHGGEVVSLVPFYQQGQITQQLRVLASVSVTPSWRAPVDNSSACCEVTNELKRFAPTDGPRRVFSNESSTAKSLPA
jgi:hypothetical protein